MIIKAGHEVWYDGLITEDPESASLTLYLNAEHEFYVRAGSPEEAAAVLTAAQLDPMGPEDEAGLTEALSQGSVFTAVLAEKSGTLAACVTGRKAQ